MDSARAYQRKYMKKYYEENKEKLNNCSKEYYKNHNDYFVMYTRNENEINYLVYNVEHQKYIEKFREVCIYSAKKKEMISLKKLMDIVYSNIGLV